MTGLHVTAGDFNRKPGFYQDQAKSGPIVVTRNGREQVVLIDIGQYKKMLQSYRQTMFMADLSDDQVELLAKSKMDTKHDHMNVEIAE